MLQSAKSVWKKPPAMVVVRIVVVPKLEMPDTFKFVPVALVNIVFAKLVKLVTLKLVVVTPIPTTLNPPIIVVLTLVPPIWIPPATPPVPILTVVVPAPVAIFTVLDIPVAKVKDDAPIKVALGNEVEAAMVKYVLEASDWKPMAKNDEVAIAG